MTERSARFSLPFLLPGQAQKELFHNEAIAALDGLVHAAVEGEAATPPVSPANGECWLVAAGAVGPWADHEYSIACFTAGGWRFLAPVAGLAVWDMSANLQRRWTGSAWSDGAITAAAVEIGGQRVIGPREPDIALPVGGATIDAEARSAVSAVIVTLKSHGLID